MSRKSEETEKMAEKTAHGVEKAAESTADTILAIMDKLVGKESDLTLRFENLTLDISGRMKTTLNGAITLDIVYAKELGTTGTSGTISTTGSKRFGTRET